MKNILQLVILLIGINTYSSADIEDTTWKYKEWETTLYAEENIVKSITHGTAVWGHQFGLIRKKSACDRNLLWLSWSTIEKDLKQYEGEDVEFSIDIDGEKFYVTMKLLDTYSLHPKSSTNIAAFTNHAVGDKFLDTLKKGNHVNVSIIGPKHIVKKFDMPYDEFSLNGFTANYTKSIELCGGQNKMRSTSKQDDSSRGIYTIKGNGEECNIIYNSQTGTILDSTCISLFNSKGIKIYCTKNKKMCKTKREVYEATNKDMKYNNDLKASTQKKQKTLNSDKVIVSCNNAKVDFFDLSTGKSDGYKKDSMTMDIVLDEVNKKIFAKSNTSKTELIDISSSNKHLQFIEQVASGHNVLYTLHKDNILTIQKSYDFIGLPVMVNMYLECE